MNSVVIVGVGGIGFRHFQSVLNCEEELEITLIDLDETALDKCKNESRTRSGIHEVRFKNNYEGLAGDIDVLIIATSSKPRKDVFMDISSKCNVKHVIFEKFLFPKLSDYDEVADVLKEKQIDAYVNCPGRLFPGYKELKNHIGECDNILVVASGSNWGLACNTIHIIDQIGFLLGRYDPLIIDNCLLNSRLTESKRNGYVEFTGSLICSLGDKAKFVLDSYDGEGLKFRITVIANGIVYTIYEGDQKCYITENNGASKEKEFKILYQSQLSEGYVKRLLNNEDCGLTKYDDTVQWHKALLKSFLEKYNDVKGCESDSCPIT